MAATTITDASLELFKSLADDAANWSGTPPVWISKEERGNLTQLKKAGLLSTFEYEGDSWVSFSESGVALAKTLDIDLSWI